MLVLATKIDKLAAAAQRAATRAIERDIAAAFPVHTAQIAVVGFSATRRIGVEQAEATLGAWLAEAGASRRGRPEKKEPRAQGEWRGARKTPGRSGHRRGHPLREESGRRYRLTR